MQSKRGGTANMVPVEERTDQLCRWVGLQWQSTGSVDTASL